MYSHKAVDSNRGFYVDMMASNSGDDDAEFEAYLLQNGVKSNTLKRLKDEDIGNSTTLKALSDKDIDELGLTVGQRAIIKRLATDDVSDKKGRQPSRKARLSLSDDHEFEEARSPPPDAPDTDSTGIQLPTRKGGKEHTIGKFHDIVSKKMNKLHESDKLFGKHHHFKDIVHTATGSQVRPTIVVERPHEDTADSGEYIEPLPPTKPGRRKPMPPQSEIERKESYSEAADEYVQLKNGAIRHVQIVSDDEDDECKQRVTLRRQPNEHMNNTEPEEMAPPVPERTSVPSRQLSIDNTGQHELEMKLTCLKTGDKGKIVAELTTQHQEEITPLPTRILMLCDISGSMGIKTGRRRRHSKLNHLKRFVMSMVGALDNGDHAALVTFGEKAEVILPLTEITDTSRDRLKAKVDQLDKSYLSTKTNLSAGLSTALGVFGRASSSQADLLKYRNMIIVCSDGEINLGTQETGKLIHEVREKIREMAKGLDDTQNQWVSISTIATGSESTEMLYALSKFCSSDAFYHIDTDKSNLDPEVDLFLPVMLRKVAVVWNVSFRVESFHGAILINSECTQDNKVRIRNPKSPRGGDRTEKAYFYYDIPAASTKHIGLVLDLEDLESTSDPNKVILTITVVFTGISQKRRSIKRDVTLGEVFNPNKKEQKVALEASYMHDARILSQIALHSAAENVKSGDARQSRIDITEGKSELQKLMESYGQIAQEEEVNLDIISYAGSLMKNMTSLLDCLGATSGDSEDDPEVNGKNWMKIKAVSSAITREAPTLSDTVQDNDLLCPLPNVARVHSPLIREQMERVYKKQGVRRTRFEQFDDVVDELSKSFKRMNERK